MEVGKWFIHNKFHMDMSRRFSWTPQNYTQLFIEDAAEASVCVRDMLQNVGNLLKYEFK